MAGMEEEEEGREEEEEEEEEVEKGGKEQRKTLSRRAAAKYDQHECFQHFVNVITHPCRMENGYNSKYSSGLVDCTGLFALLRTFFFKGVNIADP